jgi:hypothetical protein
MKVFHELGIKSIALLQIYPEADTTHFFIFFFLRGIY